SRLVAVIDHRRTDVSELKERGQFQTVFRLRETAIILFGQDVERAVGVVRIEQVEHRRAGLRRIVFAYSAQSVIELARLERDDLIAAVVVVINPTGTAARKVQDVFAEAIVHLVFEVIAGYKLAPAR